MLEKKDFKDLTTEKIKEEFDKEFRVNEDEDCAMSRFVPMVYDPIGYNWAEEFEPDFVKNFNGLMIKPEEDLPIKKVWLLSFLNDYMINEVLTKASEGEMIFAHHPVQMESGDSREGGKLGKGFLPINPKLLKTLKDKKLSIYTCHAPLDAGTKSGLGTNESLMKMIGAKQVNQYMEYAHGYAARVCQVEPQTIKNLLKKISIPNLDYIDIRGNRNLEREITKVTIIPGGGGNVKDIQPAEEFGSEIVITGQVACTIEGERGEKERDLLEQFYPKTKMTLIGLSHAGSEFPAMVHIAEWIKEKFNIDAEAMPEKNWWR
jgi:putative NIF3 family GTP cyclohydrolase 1 type 2